MDTQEHGGSSEGEQAPQDGGEYKVGPGRPPKEYQWKKGQSGNPGGRKKGESLTAMLRRVLEREHGGRPIGELLVERLVKEALSGKLPHLKEVLDRVEGKVTDQIKLEASAPPGIVVLNMPPPRVIGEPEVDAAARAAHDQNIKELSKQAPPGSKIVVGDCWLKM